MVPGGAGTMAALRIYVKNGRDLRELVRYQKQEEPEKEGEPDVLSWEHKRANPLGPYWEKLQATLSLGQRNGCIFRTGFGGCNRIARNLVPTGAVSKPSKGIIYPF